MATFSLSEVASGQVIKSAHMRAGVMDAIIVPVSYSATPTFDTAQGGAFVITLTGNVTSSTLTGLESGKKVCFKIIQDGTGGRSFVWPTNVLGGMTLDGSSAAGEIATQEFYCFDGTNLEAVSVGAIR